MARLHDEITWLAQQGISTGTDVGGAFVFRPRTRHPARRWRRSCTVCTT